MVSSAPVEGGQTRNFGGTGGNPPVSGNINNSNAMGNSVGNLDKIVYLLEELSPRFSEALDWIDLDGMTPLDYAEKYEEDGLVDAFESVLA